MGRQTAINILQLKCDCGGVYAFEADKELQSRETTQQQGLPLTTRTEDASYASCSGVLHDHYRRLGEWCKLHSLHIVEML